MSEHNKETTLNICWAAVPDALKDQFEASMRCIEQRYGDDVAMIWLSASDHRRSDKRSHIHKVSDNDLAADLLVVLNNDHSITNEDENSSNKIAQAYLSNDVTAFSIHQENLEKFNEAIDRNDYRYMNLINNGIVLYSRDEKLLSRLSGKTLAIKKEKVARQYERMLQSREDYFNSVKDEIQDLKEKELGRSQWLKSEPESD